MTKWYGSVHNRMMEGGELVQPYVGLGVTECCYTDRHAYTIVEVTDNKRRFWMTADSYTYDEHGYGRDYKTNREGPRLEVRKFKGRWKILRGNRVIVGTRDAYYDPHFWRPEI